MAKHCGCMLPDVAVPETLRARAPGPALSQTQVGNELAISSSVGALQRALQLPWPHVSCGDAD